MPDDLLEQQLLGLSPRAKWFGGLGLAAVGIVLSVALWERGLIAKSMLFAVVLGLGFAVTGRQELRRERAIADEVARARGEWSQLRADIGRLHRTRGNIAQYLQRRGYRQFEVRRWLLRELRDGSQPGGR
jgi:hypothetical protein